MFDRFVKPELATTCGLLTNSFYHLDGVQWIPGEGKAQGLHWADVYRKIARSGKMMMVTDVDTVDLMASEGHGPQVLWLTASDADCEDKARAILARYGIG